MIKTAIVTTMREKSSDRRFWLSRPVEERIAAVEVLRQQLFEAEGHAEQGLQRVCRITQRKRR